MAVLTIDPRELVARSPALLNGNTPWASAYMASLRKVIVEHATQAPRTLQRHLGPSELGHVCDRNVAGKMAAQPATNHVNDPWASIVGTAIHAWLAEAFTADNGRHGLRWIAESRVVPHPDHPGTADIYDAVARAVVDWKNLGESSMAKVKAVGGPPRHYVVQLLLYGRGYRNLGLPVDRVVLAALPRTKSTLDSAYAWERPYTPADDTLLEEVFAQTAVRKLFAQAIIDKRINLMDVPATPTDDGCYFCLSGETEVVTRQGICKISELAGESHELLIPQSRRPLQGEFRSVPVRSFGVQPLQRIVLRQNFSTKIVYATAEHNWVLMNSVRSTTADLRVSDELAGISADETPVPRWFVQRVEKTNRVEEVFCATVPGVEAFALTDGLVTGNCPFYRPEVARPGAIDTVGCPGTVGYRP